jgi:hypothetical protein
MLSDRLKECPSCRKAWYSKISRESRGMIKAASSYYQGKLKELGAIIKGTAKPISDYELEKQRRQQINTKGASLTCSRYHPVEREVKLKELGKMIKGL